MEKTNLGQFFGFKTSSVPGVRMTLRSTEDRVFIELAAVVNRVLEDLLLFVTFQGDVDGGNFPAIVDSCFRDEAWRYERRFYLREVLKDTAATSCTVGSFTFEAVPDMLPRMVLRAQGNKGGANRRVGGLLVPSRVAAQTLVMDPFDPASWDKATPDLGCAFNVDPDFLFFDLFIPSADPYVTRHSVLSPDGASISD